VYVPDGAGPELSRGEITFTRDKKSLSELSPEERYILGGAKVSDLPDSRWLLPWADQIFNLALAYHTQHGKLPAVLDEAAIRSIPYYSAITAAELDVYRNPFSGNWPRLDASAPSPGDMFIKVLNETELVEYARLLGRWQAWFGGAAEKKLCSPVFYQRIYGTNGPIYESLPHVTCGSE
jgi:hypothetical protein